MNRREFITSAALGVSCSAVSAFLGYKFGSPQFFEWIKITDDGGLAHRDDAVSFEHNNQFWISGGYQYGGAALRDLLVYNGESFTLINPETPWRAYAPMASDGNFIYIAGNELLRTRDGINLEVVMESVPWGHRGRQKLLWLNEKFHLVTGTEVYHILPSGIVTGPTPLPWGKLGRENGSFAAIVYNGKIVIVAGDYEEANTPVEQGYSGKTSLNEIWTTDNPERPDAWESHQAPFTPRMWPSLAVHDGALFLAGGYNNVVSANFADTWRTEDLSNWIRLNCRVSFPARHAVSLYSYNGRLRLFAGNMNPRGRTMSDIWELKRVPAPPVSNRLREWLQAF